eukprot:CAMPEP_0182539148 /NCGR_PEP_ID=MMETSP1323-20130603/24885_1 /TAXON_ID=236787 /ORGANISM="Florenciella parvula, Strain RCC1693" /LENGTH=62 /DNA_ID=CAMNT_0024749677 /DNA_START=348 /DNA_END=532 /DNA_ORIENTATION=+
MAQTDIEAAWSTGMSSVVKQSSTMVLSPHKSRMMNWLTPCKSSEPRARHAASTAHTNGSDLS